MSNSNIKYKWERKITIGHMRQIQVTWPKSWGWIQIIPARIAFSCGPVLDLAQVTPTASLYRTRSNVVAVWRTGRLDFGLKLTKMTNKWIFDNQYPAFLCLRAGFWAQTYKNDKQVGFFPTNIQLSFNSKQVDQALFTFLAHSIVAQLLRWMMGHAAKDILLGAILKTLGPEISCN